MEKIKKWFRGLKAEIKKIVWPTKKKVAGGSLAATAFMVVTAAVLFGFDTLADMLVRAILSLM